MTRPMKLLLVLVVLIAGGLAWWSRDRVAEAAPKPREADSCRDELARTKQQLAETQEELRKTREEATAAKKEFDQLHKKEQARLKRLQEQLGSGVVDDLK